MNRILHSFFPIILLISLAISVVPIPVSASSPTGAPEVSSSKEKLFVLV